MLIYVRRRFALNARVSGFGRVLLKRRVCCSGCVPPQTTGHTCKTVAVVVGGDALLFRMNVWLHKMR